MWGVEAPTGGLLPWSTDALLVHQEDVAPAAPTVGVFGARGPSLVGIQPGEPALLGRVGALELVGVLSPRGLHGLQNSVSAVCKRKQKQNSVSICFR